MKPCPYCAEDIQDAAIMCRYCGHDLRIPVQPPVSKRPATAPAQTRRLDWRSGAALAGALLVSLGIYKLIMDRFLNQPLGLFDSLSDAVIAFYATTQIALGIGFTAGGFIAGSLSSEKASRFIGLGLGVCYAVRLVGLYALDKGEVTPELLTLGVVIVSASAIGGLIGSVARSNPPIALIVFALGGLAAFGIVNGTGSSQSTQASDRLGSASSEGTLVQTATPPITNRFGSTSVVPCVGIMSEKVTASTTGVQAVGTLKNLCDRPVVQIRLRLTLFDARNQVINSVYGAPASDIIFPGQSATFSMQVTMPNALGGGYTLVVDKAEYEK